MLKNDIKLYKDGNRAAEMRLISFILDCEKRLDRNAAAALVSVGGKVGTIARLATEKIAAELLKKQAQVQLKIRIQSCLNAIESSGFFRDAGASKSVWVPLLKEASALRWRLKTDQEVYNIDLRIRRMIDLARQIGISI